MTKSILIVDTGGYCTRNRARRFIRDGKAKWTDETMVSIIFRSHYEQSASYQPPRLDIIIAPKWVASYRTQGAPAIGPWAGGSPDWFRAYRTQG